MEGIDPSGARPKGGFVLGRILHPPLPAALVLFVLLVVASSCGASPGGEARQAKQPPEGSGSTGELGDPALGAADAPVVMVEWGDFQ